MFKNDVSNINKWSSTEIEVICDDCNKEKTIKYKLYTSYGYSDGMYLCRTCKTKKSNLEKWGAENPFKLDSVKEKIKSTNLERLGVENPSQSPYIQEKIRENNLRKLGVEHHSKLDSTKEKIKSTNLERLGVENPSQSDEIKRKKSETSIKNWGTSVPLHSDTIKEKIKADNLEKWGNENYLLTENFKTKANKTNLEKWGHTNPTMNKDIKLKIKNSVLDKLHKRMMEDNNIIKIDSEKRIFILNCQNCNNNYEIGYFLFYKRRETKTEICTICNPIDKHQSGKEIALYNFIKSVYDGEIIQNWRTNNKEIDIYLPDKSIGFEFNGVYWHSEIFKDRMFHHDKTKFFNDKGIKILHIWEDDWCHKEEIVKSMIRNKLGSTLNKIDARKCRIVNLNVKECDIFLNSNHLQGTSKSSIRIALEYGDKIVSVLTFKKNGETYELTRFCNSININVRGSFTKLLNYFTKNYSKDIITFSDNSYSDGSLYEKCGFEIISVLKPDYKFVENEIRIHKFNFRNRDTKDIPKIWDCGKLKWQLIK